jgi:hypothetical protein
MPTVELNELGEPLRADASDLWWCRPAGWAILCHGCGDLAERFRPGLCWLCVASAEPTRDPATGELLKPTPGVA